MFKILPRFPSSVPDVEPGNIIEGSKSMFLIIIRNYAKAADTRQAFINTAAVMAQVNYLTV